MVGETRDDGSDDVPRRSISIEPEKWWKNAQSRGERREEGEEWKKEKKEEIGGGGPIKRGRERRRMNGRAVWNLGNAHSLLFSFFPLSFFFLFPPPPSPRSTKPTYRFLDLRREYFRCHYRMILRFSVLPAIVDDQENEGEWREERGLEKRVVRFMIDGELVDDKTIWFTYYPV